MEDGSYIGCPGCYNTVLYPEGTVACGFIFKKFTLKVEVEF